MRIRFPRVRFNRCRAGGWIKITGLVLLSVGTGILLSILLPMFPLLLALILIFVGAWLLFMC